MWKFKIVILIFLNTGYVMMTHANEGEAPPSHGESGGHGGQTNNAESNIPFEQKKQQIRTKEWMDLTSKLSGLKSKIEAKEAAVKELIASKNHAHSKADAESIVTNLLIEHKDLKKLTDEYNENSNLLRYRYPDVGITDVRKYKKIQMKSLEDYEKGETLSDKIEKTIEKAKQHYGMKEEKTVKEKKEVNASTDNNNLAKPIILRK